MLHHDKMPPLHPAGCSPQGVWQQLDLSTDKDMDNNGTYVLIALEALKLLYSSSQERNRRFL